MFLEAGYNDLYNLYILLESEINDLRIASDKNSIDKVIFGLKINILVWIEFWEKESNSQFSDVLKKLLENLKENRNFKIGISGRIYDDQDKGDSYYNYLKEKLGLNKSEWGNRNRIFNYSNLEELILSQELNQFLIETKIPPERRKEEIMRLPCRSRDRFDQLKSSIASERRIKELNKLRNALDKFKRDSKRVDKNFEEEIGNFQSTLSKLTNKFIENWTQCNLQFDKNLSSLKEKLNDLPRIMEFFLIKWKN